MRPAGAQITVNRDAPICFTDFLGAVKTSTISGVPSGTYTINSSDFSDGSNPTLSDGSTLVYDGSGTNFTLTGLTPGTTYFVKVLLV